MMISIWWLVGVWLFVGTATGVFGIKNLAKKANGATIVVSFIAALLIWPLAFIAALFA